MFWVKWHTSCRIMLILHKMLPNPKNTSSYYVCKNTVVFFFIYKDPKTFGVASKSQISPQFPPHIERKSELIEALV